MVRGQAFVAAARSAQLEEVDSGAPKSLVNWEPLGLCAGEREPFPYWSAWRRRRHSFLLAPSFAPDLLPALVGRCSTAIFRRSSRHTPPDFHRGGSCGSAGEEIGATAFPFRHHEHRADPWRVILLGGQVLLRGSIEEGLSNGSGPSGAGSRVHLNGRRKQRIFVTLLLVCSR